MADKGADSVARSTALMSVATLGSRVTGLLRTWTMAFALGNTLVSSAYQVANNMPNAIYDLVAGGLLGAAFIPVYLLQKEKLGDKGSNEFANNILNITILLLGVISVLASLFAPQVMATQTFTVGEQAAVVEYAVLFFRIFAWQIVFYGAGAVITGVLNANRVYFLPSLAPALNNVVVIASFIAYTLIFPSDPMVALIVVATGTTIGVVIQTVIQLPALFKMGYRYKLRINWKDPALIDALKITGPTFIYIVGTLVSFTFRNAFSLQSGDNGASTLNYAWMWFQLPYGVIAVSLSRAMFTEMSEATAQDDMPRMRTLVRDGLSNTLLMIIPLAGLMGVLSEPIMSLFRAGAFNADDVVYVARILMLWCFCLPCYSILMYLYNTFASLRRFLSFALICCCMVVVQCVLYATMCNNDMMGLAGVPFSDFIYYTGCSIIALALLKHRIGSFQLKSVLWTAVRTLVATAVGVALVWFLMGLLPPMEGMLGGFIRICIGGIVGLVVIFGLCALLRIEQMDVVKNLLKRITGKLLRR